PAVQDCPDERWVEPESLADALEIERPIGGGRPEPRVRIGEEPPSTPAQRRCVLLEVADGTFQHGEHQALLWSERGPDTVENLRWSPRSGPRPAAGPVQEIPRGAPPPMHFRLGGRTGSGGRWGCWRGRSV